MSLIEARRALAAPFGEETDIILLTSLGRKGDAARCKEVGISGYLLKPVKQSELFDAIMMTLGQTSNEEKLVVTRHMVKEARRRFNILLAEDNIVNQKLAVKMLEKRGHRVVVSFNGREAIERLTEEPFDLVLMDVQMPVMDGLTATREIRNWPEILLEGRKLAPHEPGGQETGSLEDLKRSHQNQVSSIPIIAMTAHAMKGDRERCLEAGMDDYVSKPINAGKLFMAIEKLLDGSEDRLKGEMRRESPDFRG